MPFILAPHINYKLLSHSLWPLCYWHIHMRIKYCNNIKLVKDVTNTNFVGIRSNLIDINRQ